MLRLFAPLTIVISLTLAIASPVQGSTDPQEDPSWGTAATSIGTSTLTVTATQTKTVPQDGPASRGERAVPKPDACESNANVVRRSSCGIYGVRATNPEGDPLTISDLAQFAPDPIATISEPGGAGIVGLPTNFVTPADVRTQEGVLLDLPLTVRFTPVGFDTTFGDGTAATTTTGGQSWSATHQPPFTPTPTSHVYSRRGAYTASVTVRYSAEVDLGNGWFPVAGELSVPGPAQTIRIYEATTALVEHTCAEQPTAPGC